MTKLKTSLLAIGLLFLGWSCSSDSETEAPAAATGPSAQPVAQIEKYRTLVAQPSDTARTINVTGRLQPLEQLQIVSEVQGKALSTSKLLNEGVRYRKGETLVRIEDEQYRFNLNAQKSQFQAALVRIMSQLKLDYPEAHPAWDTYLRNFDPGTSIPELPETSDDQLRFFLSANNIFSSYYSIKSAEELLPKYRIQAPFTGVIIQGQVAPGSVINPGSPLATFSRTDVYELKAAISAASIDRFNVGQKLNLTNKTTGKSWTGTIHRIGGAIDPGTQSVPIYVRVGGRGLRENMFLETNIDAGTQEAVVALPLNALNRNNEVHFIQDSTVQLREVIPVRYEGNQVWVSGLQGGEQIIVDDIIEPIVGSKALPQS